MDTALEKKHVVKTPGTCGGKPRIEGTRIRVQDVYVWHELQGQAPEEIVNNFPHLSLADVYSALAYFFDHRDEILRDVQEDHEYVEQLKSSLALVLSTSCGARTPMEIRFHLDEQVVKAVAVGLRLHGIDATTPADTELLESAGRRAA